MLKGIDFHNATNGHIANHINWFIEHLKHNERGFFKDQYEDRNDDHPLNALELVAKKFEEDGPNEFNYLENRIRPPELDTSLA